MLPHCVLICVSLITNGVPRLFVCLIAIHISYWWSSYSNIWPILNIGLFAFLFLSLKGSSLHVPDKSPWLDICLANIFSLSLAWFFILLTVSFQDQIFNFNEVQFLNYFSGSRFLYPLKFTKIFFYIFVYKYSFSS